LTVRGNATTGASIDSRDVEAPRSLQIANADPQVLDGADGHGVVAVAVDRLDAVAVGSSRT
jgi:hypothetical protein